jgi:hypothetical protein
LPSQVLTTRVQTLFIMVFLLSNLEEYLILRPPKKFGLYLIKTTHEGTKVVKHSKLQILTTRFETIKLEEKTFHKFYAKLNDIVNSR